ncbi:MAG: hypothetical protein ACFFC7_12915 [Candidatus Hermodarchaeota archaeon]
MVRRFLRFGKTSNHKDESKEIEHGHEKTPDQSGSSLTLSQEGGSEDDNKDHQTPSQPNRGEVGAGHID